MSHILSKSDNITAILPFVEPRKQRDHDDKLSKSSVSSRYGAVLLLQLFQSEIHCGICVFSFSSLFVLTIKVQHVGIFWLTTAPGC